MDTLGYILALIWWACVVALPLVGIVRFFRWLDRRDARAGSVQITLHLR